MRGRGRVEFFGALVAALLLAGEAAAWGGLPAAGTLPVSLDPVDPADWAALTPHLGFGANAAAFADRSPFLGSGDPADLTSSVLAGPDAASFDRLLVLITLGPSAALGGARLTLAGESGNPLSGAEPASAVLAAAGAVSWADAGLPEGIDSETGGLPFARQAGRVLGALLGFQDGLAAAAPESGTALALLRTEILAMTSGPLRIDFVGVDGGYAPRRSGDEASLAGGAETRSAIPEPAALSLLLLGAVAIAMVARARRAPAGPRDDSPDSPG